MIAGVISGDLVAPPPSLFLSLSLSKSPRGGCVLPFVSISSNGNVFGRLPCDTSRLLVYRGAAQSMREPSYKESRRSAGYVGSMRGCRSLSHSETTPVLLSSWPFMFRVFIFLSIPLSFSPLPSFCLFSSLLSFFSFRTRGTYEKHPEINATSSLIVSCLIMARLIARNVLNNTK